MGKIKDILFVLLFWGGILAGFFYIIFAYSSEKEHYLAGFIILLATYVIYIDKSDLKPNSTYCKRNIFLMPENLDINPTTVYAILFFGIPILIIIIGILLHIVNTWIIYFSLYLAITFVLFLFASKTIISKIISFIILITLFYCGFKAIDVFKINVEVVFNNDVIFKN